MNASHHNSLVLDSDIRKNIIYEKMNTDDTFNNFIATFWIEILFSYSHYDTRDLSIYSSIFFKKLKMYIIKFPSIF